VLCCRTGTSVVVVDDDIDAWKVRIARSGENYRDGFGSGLDCIRFGCRAYHYEPVDPLPEHRVHRVPADAPVREAVNQDRRLSRSMQGRGQALEQIHEPGIRKSLRRTPTVSLVVRESPPYVRRVPQDERNHGFGHLCPFGDIANSPGPNRQRSSPP
jgi:hypothetical protein